jgi:resuscitation-promoting factor RpfB
LSTFRTPSLVRSIKFQIAVIVPVAAIAATASLWPTEATSLATATRAVAHPLAANPAAARPQLVRLAVNGQPAAIEWPAYRPAAQPLQAQLDAYLAVTAKPHVGVSGDAKGGRTRLTPRQIARRLLRRFGWSRGQFQYLNALWSRESSWNVYAENPYSGAYGIPQAVPGDKMASAGPRWQTDARTQILWGLEYIKGRYGSPEAAWGHEITDGWY